MLSLPIKRNIRSTPCFVGNVMTELHNLVISFLQTISTRRSLLIQFLDENESIAENLKQICEVSRELAEKHSFSARTETVCELQDRLESLIEETRSSFEWFEVSHMHCYDEWLCVVIRRKWCSGVRCLGLRQLHAVR